jgi:serine/threonine protein kinase
MPTTPGSHPEPRQLALYADRQLSPDEAEAVARHLLVCPGCRALVEPLSRADTPSDISPTAGPVTSAWVSGPLPSEAATLPELASHPRYQIVRVLGEGGMGTVYLAEQIKMGRRRVVLKVIRRELLSEARMVQRFQAEVEAVARLDHPNIVRAHDKDEADGLHFLVMEFIEGVSLAEYLKQQGPLPVQLACNLARQVAVGLHYAHSQDPPIIHRDIKPGNLLLMTSGQVKILDFGLARLGRKQLAGEGLTRTGVGMGTPEFMAPEQARDASRTDGRSDIYSLGATLYALLAGRPPFVEANSFDVMLAHVQREPEPVSRHRAEVPETLSAVVSRMLAKDPARRYQTAEEVARVLMPFCPEELTQPPEGKMQTKQRSPIREEETDRTAVDQPGVEREERRAPRPRTDRGTPRPLPAGGAAVALLVCLVSFLILLVLLPLGYFFGLPLLRPDPNKGNQASTQNPTAPPPPKPQSVDPEPPKPAPPAGWVKLFQGNDLSGFEGLPEVWRVSNGVLNGIPPAERKPHAAFLVSRTSYRDFELRFQVKLDANVGTCGVLLRGTPGEKFLPKGPLVRFGGGWGEWGHLTWEPTGKFQGMLGNHDHGTIKNNDFNDCYIKCAGKHVTIKVNNFPAVDQNWNLLPNEGILAFQVHYGLGTKGAHYRNVEIKEPKKAAAAVSMR